MHHGGDKFVVTKLDRLAQSTTNLWTVVSALKAKGVVLLVFDLGIDTSSRPANSS